MDSHKLLAGLIAGLLVVPALVGAQVYKVKQEDGSVLYTDDPAAEGEEVVIDETTTNTVPKLVTTPKNPPANAKKPAATPTVSIVSPQPEATIRNNQGNLTIEARAGNNAKGRFQLWFNGKPIQTNSTGRFTLTGINRGAHTYQVHLLDNKGKSLASTDTQTLYLHQASALIN